MNLNEVDCRLEHGVEDAHLEYVRTYLRTEMAALSEAE